MREVAVNPVAELIKCFTSSSPWKGLEEGSSLEEKLQGG